MAQTLLTKKGLEDLQKELKQLKEVERVAVGVELKEARAQGDLSENADYDAARDKQAKIESRIIEIENMLANAVLIDDEKSNKTVKLGTTVEILRQGEKATKTYTIVGTVEAKPLENKISNESPLAKAVLGKTVSDEWVLVKSPNPYKVKIISIQK